MSDCISRPAAGVTLSNIAVAGLAYGILYGQIGSTSQDYDCREKTAGETTTWPRPLRPKMNEFLTTYSSDHTLLWALLIIGAVAVAAISLHTFWTIVFRTVASLRGTPGRGREDSD